MYQLTQNNFTIYTYIKLSCCTHLMSYNFVNYTSINGKKKKNRKKNQGVVWISVQPREMRKRPMKELEKKYTY